MAIVNRDLDPSQQKEVLTFNVKLAGVGGGTYVLGNLPFPCEISKIAVTAKSLSGAPSVEVEGYKWAGGVTINSAIMTALAVPAFGTSGVFVSASLGVAGSTQVQLAAQDQLVATITGANTAADDLCISVVVKKLQDIVSMYGSST